MFVFIEILGGEGSPYEGGIFKLEIQIPERYIFFFQIEMGENISVLNEHQVSNFCSLFPQFPDNYFVNFQDI